MNDPPAKDAPWPSLLMKILFAFDKFKNALSAAEACEVAREAAAGPRYQLETCPLTDGGEGFATILGDMLGGQLHEVQVPGPLFKEVTGKFALVPGAHVPEAARKRLGLGESNRSETLGIVEMASASGYESLDETERDPWKTTTYGTGVLMKEAVAGGADSLLLGIGGSATNDCGAGALEALGVCYYNKELQAVTRVTPERFREINTLGSTSHLLDRFPPVRIACDVTNPLVGPQGATAVFGPQKGLREEDHERMERIIRKMGSRILGLFGINPAQWEQLLAEPGTGAAGGIGFALRHALPESRLVEGFPLVADLLKLPDKAREADILFTGEGRLDESSLTGKGPVGLLRLAKPTTRVVILAGSVDDAVRQDLLGAHPNLEICVLSDPGWSLSEALSKTASSLRDAVRDCL